MSMTDEQIVKALECCSYATSKRDCEQCPYYPDEECVKKQCTDIIDLIKRQQEEIERLKSEKDSKIVMCLARNIDKAKSKAVREFAERLKEQAKELHIGDNIFLQIVGVGRIDNLVKEMTEKEGGKGC